MPVGSATLQAEVVNCIVDGGRYGDDAGCASDDVISGTSWDVPAAILDTRNVVDLTPPPSQLAPPASGEFDFTAEAVFCTQPFDNVDAIPIYDVCIRGICDCEHLIGGIL